MEFTKNIKQKGLIGICLKSSASDKKISQEDKKTWEEYIKNPSDIYDKDQGASNTIGRRERYKFDLHGFTLDEANNKVREIIEHCIKNKFKELLLITGKGLHQAMKMRI